MDERGDLETRKRNRKGIREVETSRRGRRERGREVERSRETGRRRKRLVRKKPKGQGKGNGNGQPGERRGQCPNTFACVTFFNLGRLDLAFFRCQVLE